MKFRTRAGLLITFECEKCREECETTKDRQGQWARAFCTKCGATYGFAIKPANASEINSIAFGARPQYPPDRQSLWSRLGSLRNR